MLRYHLLHASHGFSHQMVFGAEGNAYVSPTIDTKDMPRSYKDMRFMEQLFGEHLGFGDVIGHAPP